VITETILTNATLVLPDRVQRGTIILRNDTIAAIDETPVPGGIDLDGDYVIPGIIDLHTDNLERQVQPRGTARWPSRSALVIHDAQCAAAGITTVFDALCLGDLGFYSERMQTFLDGVADLDALHDTRLLKAEHFLHLRCELPAPDMLTLLEPVADHPRVRMVSLMDHCPGVGQYADLDRFRTLKLQEGFTAATIETLITKLQAQRAVYREPNRCALLNRVAARPIILASHDDRTEQEIAENAAHGIRISEFPVTMTAACAAHAHGIKVIAGAPNIVRGCSHSGNVAAADLLSAHLVDAFASDYVPASLIEAAFRSAGERTISLPEAIAMITDQPAQIAGLQDRGRLEPGLRADLVRVRLHQTLPIVREVWCEGNRIA
jgi:alpha-D-ribose 1-methylphosphonate 5-triphosphate diphosphatase